MKLQKHLINIVWLLVVPISLLLVWEGAVRFEFVPKTLIASPSDVVVRLWDMLLNGMMFKHSVVSCVRLAIGFVIGVTLGVVLGIAVGVSPRFSKLFEPTILTLIPVPPIAWIPLLIILLGIGDVSKIALIAIGSFCTLFIHTAHAIRSTDGKLVELSSVLCKSKFSTVWNILLPSSLPAIFSASRVAMALSWTLLLCAEVIASSSGLGWLIWDSRNFSRPDDMIAGMIIVAILGKTTDFLIQKLERFLTPWQFTLRELTNA